MKKLLNIIGIITISAAACTSSTDHKAYDKANVDTPSQADIDQYNKDEGEMLDNDHPVVLKSANGSSLQLSFKEDEQGKNTVAITVDKNPSVILPIKEEKADASTYANDTLTLIVTDAGGKATLKDKQGTTTQYQ